MYREVNVVAEQRSNDCVDTLVPDVLARAPAHKASSFNDFEFDARDGSLPDPLPVDCNVRVCSPQQPAVRLSLIPVSSLFCVCVRGCSSIDRTRASSARCLLCGPGNLRPTCHSLVSHIHEVLSHRCVVAARALTCSLSCTIWLAMEKREIERIDQFIKSPAMIAQLYVFAVSYTHLTLPTICSV